MAQMIRKQIYVEPVQEANLKNQAKSLGLTEAEVIRRAIDRHMTAGVSGFRDLSAWEREKEFILQRMAGKPGSGGRKFDREALYEERLNRYGQ